MIRVIGAPSFILSCCRSILHNQVFNAWYYYRILTSTFCLFQMKNAEINILTATWWSKLASACTTTTRLHAVHHAHEGVLESSFSRDAVSILKQGPSAPCWARLCPLQAPCSRTTQDSKLQSPWLCWTLALHWPGWKLKKENFWWAFSRCCSKIIQKRRNAFPWRMRAIYRNVAVEEEEVKRRSVWITQWRKKSVDMSSNWWHETLQENMDSAQLWDENVAY